MRRRVIGPERTRVVAFVTVLEREDAILPAGALAWAGILRSRFEF